MALLLSIILWLLLGLLILVGVALITPVFVRIDLTTSPRFTYRVEICALTQTAPRLALVEGPHKGPVSDSSPKPTKARPRKKGPRGRIHGSVIRAVPQLIQGILSQIHLKELKVDANIGLGDPADTGRLCGILMPLRYTVPMPESVSVDLRPNFTRTCLNGSLAAVVRVTAVTLLVPLTRFVWCVYGSRR